MEFLETLAHIDGNNEAASDETAIGEAASDEDAIDETAIRQQLMRQIHLTKHNGQKK